MKIICICFLFFSVSCFGASSFEDLKEQLCLSKNVYFESGNQEPLGQRAVAWVTLNRYKSTSSWPTTICDVVYQPSFNPLRPRACQFSWTCQRNFVERIRKNEELIFDQINIISYRILKGIDKEDITFGATHYVRCDIAHKVTWLRTKKLTVRIKDHCFFKRDPNKTRLAKK